MTLGTGPCFVHFSQPSESAHAESTRVSLYARSRLSLTSLISVATNDPCNHAAHPLRCRLTVRGLHFRDDSLQTIIQKDVRGFTACQTRDILHWILSYRASDIRSPLLTYKVTISFGPTVRFLQ